MYDSKTIGITLLDGLDGTIIQFDLNCLRVNALSFRTHHPARSYTLAGYQVPFGKMEFPYSQFAVGEVIKEQPAPKMVIYV
jgi:hypothetical protein